MKPTQDLIYELLNPKGSHGQGDIFLQEFVKTVLGLNDAKNIKNPKREDVMKQSEDNGRIDFTIDSTNYVIGVEMKIHAGDQPKQMHRYYGELEERSKQKIGSGVKLFYLTLHGMPPSKKSTEGLAENKYQNISFKEDVLSLSSSLTQAKIELQTRFWKTLLVEFKPSNDNSDAINVDVSTLTEDIKRLVESVEENANKD